MNEFAFVIAASGFLTILVSGFLYIWAGFFPNPKEVIRFAKRMLAIGALLLLTGMLIAAFLDAGKTPPHPVVGIPAAHLASPANPSQPEPLEWLVVVGVLMTVSGLALWISNKRESESRDDGLGIAIFGIFAIFIAYLPVLYQTIRLFGG